MLRDNDVLDAFGRAGVVLWHSRGSVGLFHVADVRKLAPRAALDVVLYVPEGDDQQRAGLRLAAVDALSRWRVGAQGGWFRVPLDEHGPFFATALDAIGPRLAAPGGAFALVERARGRADEVRAA
jgi:hypothetical protein